MNVLLLVFTFLMPLENRTSVWLNFGGGFNLTTILTMLLLIGWMFVKRSNAPKIKKSPLNFPAVLFLIFTCFSFFTGYINLGIPFFGNEFRQFKSFLIIFILFFVVANNVKDKKSMKLLLGVMTIMVVLASIVAQNEFRGADIWHYNEETRISVFGMQPNMLGAFLGQFIPVFAAFGFLSKKLRSKIFYTGLFSICLPGLMFTYSRGAYLGIAGALIIMTLSGGKKALGGFILVLAIAIFAQAILFGKGRIIPVSVRERMEMMKHEQIEKDKSAQLRKEVWELARGYIGESPVFGYGYGASDHLLYLGNPDSPIDTHNMYLDIALECGIPALLIFLWFILAAFKTAFQAFKATQDDFYKAISLGAMGSVVALAIGNYFGTRLILLAANGYFAILMGMTARIYYLDVDKKSSLFK